MTHVRTNKNQNGFTLVEIAVVILIIGLLLAGIAQIFNLYVKEKRQAQMLETSQVIRTALADFIIDDPADPSDTHSRYPCPADPSLSPGQPGYGLERRDSSGNCIASAALVRVGGNGGNVFIGSVPVNTLGISAAYILDPFNNQFTYAISENVVQDDSMDNWNSGPPGHINVINDGVAVAEPVQFTLISHGEDGAGSYTSTGVLNGTACNNLTVDGENCDRNDGNFAFESALSLGSNNEFYDDIAAFNLSNPITDDEWWTSNDGGVTIENRNSGTVTTGQDLTVGRNLNVTNDLVSSNINVSNNATIGNTLTVTNDITSTNGTISAAGDISSTNGDLNARDINSSRNIMAAGDINGNNLRANNDLSSRNLDVSNNAAIAGELSVGGNIHAQGDISADGRILISAACPTGQYLSAISNGAAVCELLPVPTTPIADITCPAGQAVSGFVNNVPQCANVQGNGGSSSAGDSSHFGYFKSLSSPTFQSSSSVETPYPYKEHGYPANFIPIGNDGPVVIHADKTITYQHNAQGTPLVLGHVGGLLVSDTVQSPTGRRTFGLVCPGGFDIFRANPLEWFCIGQ